MQKIFLRFLFIMVLCATRSAFAKPLVLSLDDAILLAVRSNPNVQTAQLNYIEQKFNSWIQEWEFKPHYSLQGSAIFGGGVAGGQLLPGTHNYDVQPTVSLLTPVGTQVSLLSDNQETNHFNPGLSLQILQPLMRGFGRPIVEAALNNAKDSEVISRLTIEGTLRNTVTIVINAYLDVMMAQQTILIDQEALARAEKSVTQTKIYIKAGHKAGNELVTVKANVASAKSQLENDKNNLLQARYALFAAIGIDPNSDILFSDLNLNYLINKYHLPTLIQTKNLILEKDIQYQIDNITLYGPTSRSLLIAEDNTRWQLNFSATASTGNGAGGGKNAGINSLFNGTNQGRNVGLTLQIPIDDQQAKQAVFNAKIALQQAEIALLQEKWNKQTSAINGWNNVVSAKRALIFAEDAAKLQRKTYQVSFKKYLHGLIDSLELQTAQVQLVTAQQTLLNARINYLKALVNLDLLTGNTLDTWHINVRT